MQVRAAAGPVSLVAAVGHPHSLVRAAGLLAGVAAILLAAILSLRLGSISVSNADAWHALVAYDRQDYAQVVVRELRVPRTVMALVIGAGLATAGAVAQAVTRNPLADPALLGISNGATLGVVVATYSFGIGSVAGHLGFGFAGGIAGATAVYLVATAGRGRATPIKLALAGIAVAGLASAWSNALILIDRETMDTVRFWLAGSVAGRDLGTFGPVAPLMLGGMAACVLLGHQLNILSMQEETARSLGMNTGRIRFAAFALIVLITSSAVAVAGPIAFVGLAVPHIVRPIVGADYRWILPYSIIAGAVLLTAADILGRVIARPGEIQVGVVTALAGAPFLIVLARRTPTAATA